MEESKQNQEIQVHVWIAPLWKSKDAGKENHEQASKDKDDNDESE